MSSSPARPVFAAPPALGPGARIAVVAPSSPFDVAAFERGVARLRDRYDVRYGEGLLERKGYFAGDDARRLAELRAAVADPDVDAIVAARGGYGATRLLPDLDLHAIRRGRKLLVGFSDVTALHAAWLRAGVRAIHGPMIAALGSTDGALLERWIEAVEGRATPSVGGLEVLRPGVAEGPLVGGNLAVLCALAGTPYAPPLDGCILFLEDVGERPYRVDRMLTTLHHAGWLARVGGLALGAFTKAGPGDDGTSIGEVLRERLSSLGVPVLAGLPAGHVDDNLELPLGAPVRVDADEGRLEVLEPAVRRAGA